MRRTALLMATMMVGVLAAAGMAWAADISCPFDGDGSFLTWVGTSGDDTITGSKDVDRIDARDGNDTVRGGAGGDLVYGGYSGGGYSGADDTLHGDRGDDALVGSDGTDWLYGGGGADHINALAVSTSTGSVDGGDRVYGGSGNDRVDADDGHGDIVDCGPGRNDTVRYDDDVDTISRCENAIDPTPTL